MNRYAKNGLAVVATATAVVAGGWAVIGAAASAAVPRTASTVSDFGSGTGKMTMQVSQSGTAIDAVSFTLTCSANAVVAASPKVKIGRSGDFSYSGPATLTSGSKQKQSKTTMRVSGRIDFTKAGTLRSAKTNTVTASTTAAHCSPYSGRLTGTVVPPGTGG
jgi:hypothetical protein